MKQNRRKFLETTIKSSALLTVSASSIGGILSSCSATKNSAAVKMPTGFEQTPLPYAYSALENVIDERTMEIHYSKHAAGYAKNLQDAVKEEKADASQPLEVLLANISKYSSKMRNNAGGHFNHELFWRCMRAPGKDNLPSANIRTALDSAFGSFENFKKEFSNAASTRFGSGWAWLYKDNNNALKIGSTPNQDNPLMNVSDIKGTPLLGLDVWEHAYYLKYQNKRADYISNWWKAVNWDYVEQRYSL